MTLVSSNCDKLEQAQSKDNIIQGLVTESVDSGTKHLHQIQQKY